jgi:hypothetical protein
LTTATSWAKERNDTVISKIFSVLIGNSNKFLLAAAVFIDKVFVAFKGHSKLKVCMPK